ncbi:MAG: hypothetical protein HWN69_08925 [Desulfobacterales bacterium]|nr:hypothetical protein [Desulfobacterales bacterium]
MTSLPALFYHLIDSHVKQFRHFLIVQRLKIPAANRRRAIAAADFTIVAFWLRRLNWRRSAAWNAPAIAVRRAV